MGMQRKRQLYVQGHPRHRCRLQPCRCCVGRQRKKRCLLVLPLLPHGKRVLPSAPALPLHRRRVGLCSLGGNTCFLRLDLESGGTTARDWAPLLAAAFPESAGATLENMLLLLVGRCHAHRQSGEPGTECIEFWAGLANLTLEHVRQGLACRRFDKAYSSAHN